MQLGLTSSPPTTRNRQDTTNHDTKVTNINMEHSNMEETRGIEYQIKASSETTIGSGCDGSNGKDDARNDDRSNEESHRQSSKQEEKEAKSNIQHLPSVLHQTKSFVHNSITNGSKNENIEEDNCERNEVKHGHKKSPDKEESN